MTMNDNGNFDIEIPPERNPLEDNKPIDWYWIIIGTMIFGFVIMMIIETIF